MNKMIKLLSKERFNDYLDNKFRDSNCDTFITYDSGKWIACDDSTEQKWVEEFDNLDSCYRWLIGEYEL